MSVSSTPRRPPPPHPLIVALLILILAAVLYADYLLSANLKNVAQPAVNAAPAQQAR